MGIALGKGDNNNNKNASTQKIVALMFCELGEGFSRWRGWGSAEAPAGAPLSQFSLQCVFACSSCDLMKHQEGTARASLREKCLKVTPANGRELEIQRHHSGPCFCPLKTTSKGESLQQQRKILLLKTGNFPGNFLHLDPLLRPAKGNEKWNGKKGRGTTGAFVSPSEGIAHTPAYFTGALKSVHGGNMWNGVREIK